MVLVAQVLVFSTQAHWGYLPRTTYLGIHKCIPYAYLLIDGFFKVTSLLGSLPCTTSDLGRGVDWDSGPAMDGSRNRSNKTNKNTV